MPDLVTVDDIRRAAERVRGIVVRTPLVPYPEQNPPLLIKPESLQPIGAFKLRGAHATLSGIPAESRRGVIAHSSGNHAQAVAYVARALGVPAVIVMPETTSQVKVERTRRLGAEVVFSPPSNEARRRRAEELAAERSYVYVPPFDDERVIAGQGTVGLEIVEDAPDVDVVLVPVSGGGLVSGVAVAVKALNPRAKVVGVEPELAADARDSFHKGTRVAWSTESTGRTLADALRTDQVGERTFPHIQRYVDDMLAVGEDEIREAMRRLARNARLVAEPGGAVAVAASLFRRDELPPGRQVAVLSGGNVEPSLLAEVVGSPKPYVETG
ncbi:MAG: pyridoxal-phosphate dependent enzyme [Streptosporangiales bacterium]|nr:pyridoxal-phosphate dependent enzyme [Streptosporangiales bacterium]